MKTCCDENGFSRIFSTDDGCRKDKFSISELKKAFCFFSCRNRKIQEMIRLLRICSNNLNQYTRRANETGSIYAADIEDIRTRLDSLWDGMDKLIRGFANIS